MEKIDMLTPKYNHQSILYQYIAASTGSLVAIASGMHFGWPSPSLPQLLRKDSPIQITSSDGSWVAVMPCIGSPFGAILGALIVDRIGRKTSLLIVSPFYFLSWLVIAYTQNLVLLHISRFLAGLMDGITFTVLPMYIGEISDKRIRGFLGCSVSVTFVFGFLLINIFGLYFTIKTTALISSAVPILHLITFIWMPESPYYHMLKGNPQKAASKLRKLTGNAIVDQEVTNLNENNSVDVTGSKKFMNLFTQKGNRKGLFILLGLRLFQQFSGSYTISFYCLIIFNEAGGYISGHSGTLLYFSVQLLGSILSSIMVDKTGRRPLLITSILGSGLALTTLGMYFYLKNQTTLDISKLGFLPLAALIFYNILFNMGLSTIPVLMLGEFFPTDVKGFALCIVDILYGIVIVLASKFFQIVNDKFGMHVPFFTFALWCGLGLVFIVFCVPETKGKTLEQIQKELKGVIPQMNEIELQVVGTSLLSDALPPKS